MILQWGKCKLDGGQGRWFAVGLGTNLPFGMLDGVALLKKAANAVEDRGYSRVSHSSFWQSTAWPDPSQPKFVNSVCVFETSLAHGPTKILEDLMGIEASFGRTRRVKWAPRTLDLDLLCLDGGAARTENLQLPHPRLRERPFVLAPLAQAAPWWRDPRTGMSARALLRLSDCAGLICLPD